MKEKEMQYPLVEKIGSPELLTGREKEFRFMDKWLANIPRRLSKSRVILARRKSGKTVFVQRIFNRLWSENGMVIPFYFDIAESKVWYPDFAIKYYRAFASQTISFLERDEKSAGKRLSLKQIREYGIKNSNEFFVDDIDSLLMDKESGLHDSMWETAYSAPHRFADLFDRRFLVILDEFQNIVQYVYPDEHYQTAPIETLAGSFHYHSESKIAPMLVTGSYVGWLINIIDKYLEAGRLKFARMSPYLTPEKGLQAVYKYADFFNEPVTNETAVQINELCMSDPFFISCVIQSEYGDRDLTTAEGVVDTVRYEISARDSEMSKNWNEYIQWTLQRVNDRNAKSLLLCLNKHADRYWTPKELRDELGLDLEIDDIQRKLVTLSESDMIDRGGSDIDFRGLQDGTLNLILRHRFEKEIKGFVPDFKQEFSEKIKKLTVKNRKLQGDHLSGKLAEHLLANAFRSRKRFALSEFFRDTEDAARLEIVSVKERVSFQREDGQDMEADIVAESGCGRTVLAEVKKTQRKTGVPAVHDFQEKTDVYKKHFPDKTVLPAFLSLGGFTEEALELCRMHGIATAEKIAHF
ncbi:MAG: hypothetical protein GY862_23270 [Gammaproteobacteria bacterium]|nr:hypothetical protein [Gammaproteobacteria bacterium]